MNSILKKLLLILIIFSLIVISNLCYAENLINGYNKKNGYMFVALGHTKQTENGDILPIIWRVLNVENNKAYLLSEYVLFNNRIHPDDKEWVSFNANFKQTEIYNILNNKFLSESFTEEEIGFIEYEEGLGKLFLVTGEDLYNKKYGFTNDKSRKGFGTPHALKNGLFQYSLRYGGHSPYWTRSQSSTHDYAARCTKQDGNLGWIRVVVMNEGIRPACYLNLSKIIIQSGNGELNSPLVIKSK